MVSIADPPKGAELITAKWAPNRKVAPVFRPTSPTKANEIGIPVWKFGECGA